MITKDDVNVFLTSFTLHTLPSTHKSKHDELNYIKTTLKCNGFPEKNCQTVRDLTLNTLIPSPEELFAWKVLQTHN